MLNIKSRTLFILIFIFEINCFSGPAQGPGNFLYSGPNLTQPMVMSSSNGSLDIELVVDTYSFKSFISYTTRAYFYQGQPMIPAPTIRIKPGDKLNVKLTNKLTGMANPMSGISMNTFHGENVTNVHTHGLHVDPNIDTIFVEVNPGQSYTYNYQIPSDHAPGLHWYHAHKHGASALQVMGGLYGAIIVDPADSSQMPSELNNWTRVLLEFAHFSTKSINTLDDPFTVRTYPEFIKLNKDSLNPNFSWSNPNYQDIYLTNGQFQPNYSMSAGQNVIFDVLNASGDQILELQVMSNIGSGSTCDMTLLAMDGVYLTAPRKINFFPMLPSSRASIAILCNSVGTFYLQSFADQNARGNFVDNEVRFTQNLLTLNVGPSSTNLQGVSATSIALKKISRPSYLNDLTNNNTTKIWEISNDQTKADKDTAWIGMGKDCTITSFGRATDSASYDPRTNTNCQYLTFPGQIGTTGRYRHTGQVNTVEQLNIWGRGASPHSIHIHVNHFQFIKHVSDNGNDVYSMFWGQVGDWRDTIPALPGKISVRYTLAQYTGEVVMHCHFLMHEDMGMMASFYSGSTYCNYPDTCLANSMTKNSNVTPSPSTSNGYFITHSLVFILFLLF